VEYGRKSCNGAPCIYGNGIPGRWDNLRKVYGGKKKLSNFPYRDAILNITVKGFGNKIGEILLDGKLLENGFLNANISGEHNIAIKIKNNNEFGHDQINLVENKFSLSIPPQKKTKLENGILSWKSIENVQKYRIYCNGEIAKETRETSHRISTSNFFWNTK